MLVAKSKPSNSMELMKPEGNDSLDTYIRRAVGKEPFLSFPRPDNGPVQLFQLLHAFDQQELPGWPLLTPLKIQMQKCEKCSREFCSPINYRRHIRVHRRLKKHDKDSSKDKDLLGAFWDKLSEDETKEIFSLKDVNLEEVPGSSVMMALAALIQKPGITALPQYYLRAGSHLLDIIQARPSRFPISSQELFSILDDASERTFLCGTAAAIQKYVFDGEAGKIGLEPKNVVACTSFLLEQKLIKAWLADKDAEALRCQKLLVEEEEAAQRRQAELLERKRRKKLRQKEQKAKDLRTKEKEDAKESDSGSSEEQHPAESSSPMSTSSDSEAHKTDASPTESSSLLEAVEVLGTSKDTGYETHTLVSNGAHNGQGSGQTVERRGGRRHMVVARWQIPQKLHRGMPYPNPGSHAPRLGGKQKHGANRDLRAPSLANTTKIWSRKHRPENEGENPKSTSQDDIVFQLDQSKKSEVLIGSIAVTLGDCSSHGGNDLAEGQNDCTKENDRLNNVQEKSSSEQLTVKLWRPVSRDGKSKGRTYVEHGSREFELDVIAQRNEDANGSLTPDNFQISCVADNGNDKGESALPLGKNVHPGSLQFNSHDAKEFLSRRWKEAVATEHVTLILSPENENENDSQAVTSKSSSDTQKGNTPSNKENRLSGSGTLEFSNGGSAKPKFRMKPDRSAKIKYVPKQRDVV